MENHKSIHINEKQLALFKSKGGGGVRLGHICDENHILWTNVSIYYPIFIKVKT